VLYFTAGHSIPVEELDEKVVKIYVDDIKAKSEEIFVPFRRLLKTRKVGLYCTFCS
jgi:hypothetical protein